MSSVKSNTININSFGSFSGGINNISNGNYIGGLATTAVPNTTWGSSLSSSVAWGTTISGASGAYPYSGLATSPFGNYEVDMKPKPVKEPSRKIFERWLKRH